MRIDEVDWGGIGKRIGRAVATPAVSGLKTAGEIAGKAALSALGSRVGTDLLGKDKTQSIPGTGQLPDWRTGQDARYGTRTMTDQQLTDITKLPGFSAWSFNKLVTDELARRKTMPSPFGGVPAKPGVPAAPTTSAATTAPTSATTAPATPPAGTVSVKPGTRVKVTHPRTGGVYYKTVKGWTNEVGNPITDPTSVNQLDQYADSAGRIERIPVQKHAGKKFRGARRVR